MHQFSYVHPKIGVHAFFFLSVFSVFGSKMPNVKGTKLESLCFK